MRWRAMLVVVTCGVLGSLVVAQAPSASGEGPKSPQAVEAQRKLQANLDSAKETYRQAQAIAYKQAVADLDGALKTAMAASNLEEANRINAVKKDLEGKLASLSDGSVDLLAIIDLQRDVVSGKWSTDGALRVAPGGEAPARVKIPVALDQDYDMRIEFQRPNGGDALGVYLPLGNAGVTVLVRQQQIGLDTVNGKRFDVNETARGGDFIDKKNPAKTHVLEISVKSSDEGATIKVAFDGKLQIDWKGPVSALAVAGDWKIPGAPTLGLGSWNTSFVIRSAALRKSARP